MTTKSFLSPTTGDGRYAPLASPAFTGSTPTSNGAALVLTTDSRLSGAGAAAWQFPVEAYGAAGDGVTDDTAAINAAVTAAWTYALAHSFYAEIVFADKTYLVNGAPSTAQSGRAIIPLPLQADTANKVTLKFVGRGAAALPHWLQTVPQRAATVLKTTRSDGTNDGTLGPASVIGGPTLEQGYGGGFNTPWNNVLAAVDGISIQVPANSTYCGFDFRGCAEASIGEASVYANQTPANSSAGNITNQWTFGLAMPVVNNNALSDVGQFSCEGLCYGFMPSEHTVAQSVRCIYCITGIEWYSGNGTAMPHAGIVVYACCEAGVNAMGIYPAGSVKLRMLMLDSEGNAHGIYDPNNLGIGEVYVTGDDSSTSVDGGSNLRVINGNAVT